MSQLRNRTRDSSTLQKYCKVRFQDKIKCSVRFFLLAFSSDSSHPFPIITFHNLLISKSNRMFALLVRHNSKKPKKVYLSHWHHLQNKLSSTKYQLSSTKETREDTKKLSWKLLLPLYIFVDKWSMTTHITKTTCLTSFIHSPDIVFKKPLSAKWLQAKLFQNSNCRLSLVGKNILSTSFP